MRIVIVAGEASGDALGAGLIRAIKAICPEAVFEGIGGPRMQAQGFQTLADMERLSVMGFVEPLGRLPELLAIKRMLVRRYAQDPPDVFVGIDSPGFNLRLERDLHKVGVRTVHYVSPSVWAWGQGRIHDMARSVDRVLALLPFETGIYETHNIDVRFVGHPLADDIVPAADAAENDRRRQKARKALGLGGRGPVLALMPGSRAGEVQRLAPDFLSAAAQILITRPEAQFLIPCANKQRLEQLRALLHGHASLSRFADHFQLLDGQSHNAMIAADLVLLASGTATLEAMLLQRPMIVCYRLAPLTWLLASRLVRVPHVALPNLLAGRQLVPEYLQHAVQPDVLAAEALRLLDDHDATAELVTTFRQLHGLLRRNADQQAALAVVDMARRSQG